MKRLSIIGAAVGALFGLVLPAHATVILDDVFTNGTSRLVQNIPTRSAWYTSSTSGSFTVGGGIMTLRIAGSSVAALSYFVTNPASSLPVRLNVGDTLTATFRFAFPAIPAGPSTSQGFKLGLFDFYDGSNSPLRAVNDGSFSSGGNANGQALWVEGYALFGKTYAVFGDDQPIDIRKRTHLESIGLISASSDWSSIGKAHVNTNNFAGFDISTNYQFQTVLQRTALDTMAISMSWSNMSSGAVITSSTNDNSATNFSFDGIEFRPQNDGQAPSTNQFKEVKIEVSSTPVAASIVSNPPDHDVASGVNVTFTCKANGTLPLTYQWYYGTNTDYTSNTPVGGANIINFAPAHTPTANPTLTINNAQTTDAGGYSVIISNDYGSVTSSVATLLVADVPPGCATQPQDLTVIPGQYATFSVIATGSQPLSYQWYYNTSSLLTNATNPSLTLSNVSTNDAGTYSVIVSNPIGTVSSSNAVLTVDTNPSAPVFITQPLPLALRQGTSGSFITAAVGDQPISYQWYTNSLPIAGATSSTLNFISAQPSDAGTYAVVASNAIGTTTSSNAVLTIAPRTPPLPVIPTNQFNILDYGGYGDGISNNATAIQSAIAAAASASAATGGIVVVPTNGALNTYMSGPIVLSNNVNLQVNSGAKILMLPRFATPTVTNWPGSSFPLIDIGGVHDVAITGPGTIDGNAGFGSTNWWQSPTLAESSRPKLINIHNNSSRILIKNVTLQNSPVFHVLMKGGNESVTLDGVTWNAPGNSPNTDAMDIGSTNVLIQNCTINVGDDNIEIGGSSDACADITVSNCTFGTGHGVSIGSQTQGGVHELLVSNCWWSGTDNGIRLKSDQGEGGVVENLRYYDLSMTNVGYALIIYSYYNQSFNGVTPSSAAAASQQPTNGVTPIWRDIVISNLTVASTSGGNIAATIWGLPGMVVSNVTLYNMNVATPGKTFNIYNARDIRIINSDLTAPNTTTNTLNLYNAEVLVTNTAPDATPITLGGLVRPGTNSSLAFFNAQATITDPSMLGTGPITLGNSTLSFSPASLNSSNNPITIVDASTMAFTSGNNTLNGALSGAGALTFSVPASTLLTLRGDSSGFGGALIVSNSGTLLVNNTAGSGTGSGAVTVLSTAKLGGTGTIGGPVTVDGTLAPGTSPGTLTISNNLVLNSGAVLQYELGTSSDLVAVSSNLTLDGTVNVTDSGGFTNTAYNLFTYGGILTDNGLTVGATPNPGFAYAVDIGTAGLVKLNVAIPLSPFEQWQVQYFGSTNASNGGASFDADGDGMNNTNEFLAGTDPTNSVSALRIKSAVRQANNNVVITWSTAGGRTNVVQTSAGGVSGGYTNNFVDIGDSTTIISGSGDVTTNYVDTAGATNAPSRFYRIRLAP